MGFTRTNHAWPTWLSQWWDDCLRGESAVFSVFLVMWMMRQNTSPKFLENAESDFSQTRWVKGGEAADTNCNFFQYTSRWDNWQENCDQLGTDTFPKGTVESSALEVIKTHLNKSRSNLLSLGLVLSTLLNQVIFRHPCKQNYSMILAFCGKLTVFMPKL